MNMEETLLHDLSWRGLLHSITPDLDLRRPTTIYLGIDPTATSLHVGSLIPIVCLNKFIEHGHKVILLIGDGTAMVGDPSGKKNERQMLSNESIDHNMGGIEEQLKRLVPNATILHNSQWLHSLTLMGFLRSIGKHFSVNYMRSKDSVRAREESGISYTEFSYMLLQAYDFMHLFQSHGCSVQIGGSDQWGNITCGIELIKREGLGSAHGMTFPLLTGPNGEKFGKSADGAVWLDPALTSPYRFHQFWLNVDDTMVVQYLKYFTPLSEDSIKNIEVNLRDYADQRIAQKTLADTVTRMVHGEQEVLRANQVRELLFGDGGDFSALTKEEIYLLFDENWTIPQPSMSDDGVRITELLRSSAICASLSVARRAIECGSIYMNGSRIEDHRMIVTRANLIHDKHLVIRRGKKDYSLITFEPVVQEGMITA